MKSGVSYSSGLIIQLDTGLESLGHITWKRLKKLQVFCIDIFTLSNSLTAIHREALRGAPVLLLLLPGKPP